MKDDYKDVRKQLSKKISESTKLYNQILHVYNIAIGKNFDFRSKIEIAGSMDYNVLAHGEGAKLYTYMQKARIRYMIEETIAHKLHAPAALRQLKYEIRRLQRELSTYN